MTDRSPTLVVGDVVRVTSRGHLFNGATATIVSVVRHPFPLYQLEREGERLWATPREVTPTHAPDEWEIDFEAALTKVADAVGAYLINVQRVTGRRLLDPPWECEICGSTTTSLAGVVMHVNRHVEHGEFTPFPEDDFRRRIPKLVRASSDRIRDEKLNDSVNPNYG